MVRLIEDVADFAKTRTELFGGKINALFATYGVSSRLAHFYIQDGALLIATVGTDFVLEHLGGEFDAEETVAFLTEINAGTGLCEPAVMLALEPYCKPKRLYNHLMVYTANNPEINVNLHEFTVNSGLEKVFDILENDFAVNREPWLSDVTSRVEKGITTTFLYENHATVTALFENETSVFLTQVATETAYRGKGYASKMLNNVCEFYRRKRKRVLLICRDERLTFYQKNGFEKIGQAVNIYRFT
ncbi:MAG: GNAT family N-acetyltransferase [Oscillospiraceae bacterium]|jgi:GNAT superfamily N-acetyltransferase|nr:GNAT family N-acetyltransferase [Oscillospiraceae bacterium]